MDELDADFLQLEAVNRDALRLARLACLAARVEPHLLRSLRRALLPTADLSAELDLWHSPLVRLRNSTAMVFEPEALDRLRHELAADPRRQAALDVTRDCFRTHPPLVRLDIELNALAVIDPEIGDEHIDAAFAPLLATLRAGGEPALRAASWLLQSVPRWHPRLLASNAGWAARLGASALLGGRQLAAGLPHRNIASARLSAAMPQDAIERRRLGVTMTRQRLAFTAAENAGGAVLEVPVLSPSLLVLKIDGEPARVIEAEEGRGIALSDVSALTLRSLIGDGWRVEPGQPDRVIASTEVSRPRASGWQLLVDDDLELLEVVEEMVHRTLTHATPVTARSIETARRQITVRGLASCSTVVIGAMSTLGTRTPAVRRAESMREFVAWLKSQRPELPVIVVVTIADAKVADFLRGFEQTAIVKLNADFEQQLADCLAGFHGADRPQPETRVDLHLRLGVRSSWSLSVSGKVSIEESGELFLDARLLERVLLQSDELREMLGRNRQAGRPALKFLSDDLRRLLFDGALSNVAAWEAFVKYRERGGGVEQTCIRVSVDADTRGLLLEALNDRGDADSTFWALRAPLIRCHERHSNRRPLFPDSNERQAPLNCLVIEGDGRAGHAPEDPATSFATLNFATGNARAVAELLTRVGQPCTHLKVSEHTGDLHGMLASVLAERTWDLVHFCGHLAGTSAGDAGLVLAAEAGGIVRVPALASQLQSIRFLFLDTADGNSSLNVLRAFEPFVPALLGYQWRVDNRHATDFALRFYESLFDPRGTGYRRFAYAVLQARRSVHDAAPHDFAWMAPALTIQPD